MDSENMRACDEGQSKGDGTSQECTNARGLQLSESGWGWEGSMKALDEACSSHLCSSSFFFCVCHMYVFLYQKMSV